MCATWVPAPAGPPSAASPASRDSRLAGGTRGGAGTCSQAWNEWPPAALRWRLRPLPARPGKIRGSDGTRAHPCRHWAGRWGLRVQRQARRLDPGAPLNVGAEMHPSLLGRAGPAAFQVPYRQVCLRQGLPRSMTARRTIFLQKPGLSGRLQGQEKVGHASVSQS